MKEATRHGRAVLIALIATLMAFLSAPPQAASADPPILYRPDCGDVTTRFDTWVSFWTHPSGVKLWAIPWGSEFNGYNFEFGARCQIGKAMLVLQRDGNLVVYDETFRPRWDSGTWNSGLYAAFQRDGNFVVYGPEQQPYWASGTFLAGRLFLAVQEDGNVVIYQYDTWRVFWATNTSH